MRTKRQLHFRRSENIYSYLDVFSVIRVVLCTDSVLCALDQTGSRGGRGGPVDIAKYVVVSAALKSPRQQPRILQVVQSDGTIPLKAKMYEVEVLRDDGCCGA